MRQKIVLVDCTLREGNQSPGVHFSADESVSISKRLYGAGVDFIEIGHPYASDLEFQRVKAVRFTLPDISLLAHARARIEDVQVVKETGADWVGIFAGINETSQKFRIQRTKDEILELVSASIGFAKKIGLKVRFTVEDGSRTSDEDLLLAYQLAVESGADRICFADSVGICDPVSAGEKSKFIKENFPLVDMEVHFHDDRGLALANTLAAIAQGVTHISCSVNGIGERCGITDTCALMVNLNYMRMENLFKLDQLTDLSMLVAEITKSRPDERRPVVGQNCFTHTSKLHVAASARDVDCYQWINPGLVGRSSVLLPFSD